MMFQIPISFDDVNIVVDGNSISTNGYGTAYSDLLGTSLAGYTPTVANVSYGGKNTQDMIDEAAVDVDPLLVVGKRNIVIAFEVTNDLAFWDVDLAVEHIKTYCNDRRTAGWTVINLTCLPRVNISDPDFILPANALMMASWFTFCDAIIDVREDSRLAVLNTTYYNVDYIHTNTAGNTLIHDLILKKLRDMYGITTP